MRRRFVGWAIAACMGAALSLAAPGRALALAPAEGDPSGEAAEHDENAPPPPINWWHGLFGEKAHHEPDLFFRAPGEPPPFLASLLNFGALVLIAVRYGKKPLADSLARRKETITREIEEAQRFRREAEARLKQYETKLEKIGDELERVRREFREQGQRDQERIVREANERRERMKKDTELLLAQEAKQMQADLLAEVVNEATRLATELLSRRLTLGDHDRFAEAFLMQLRASKGGRGGASVAPPPVSAFAKGSGS